MNLNSLTHCVLTVARELDRIYPQNPTRESLLLDPATEEFMPLMMQKCTKGAARSRILQVEDKLGEMEADEAAIQWLAEQMRVELR